jgi:hypothetical protein
VSTVADGNRRRRDGECELDELASVYGSATRDKTRSDAQIFEDAASNQISDDDNSSVGSGQRSKEMAERTTLSMRRSG